MLIQILLKAIFQRPDSQHDQKLLAKIRSIQHTPCLFQMVQAIQVLRFHLLELEKVSIEEKGKYLHSFHLTPATSLIVGPELIVSDRGEE